MLEMTYTLIMIGLGCAMIYRMATRKPKTPEQVLARRARQQGVKTFPASRRPVRRQTVSLPTALAYYIAAATSLIERTIHDLRKGWRAGRAVYVMSPLERPAAKTPTAAIAPMLNTGSGIDTVAADTTIPDVGGEQPLDIEVVQALLSLRWSQNKIAARLKGSKQTRVAYIKQALDGQAVKTVDSEVTTNERETSRI